MLIATTLAAGLLYCNDFATRTSADLPPGAAWTTYKYAPGVALAYNFENNGISTTARYAKPYEWKPAQDGWTKAFTESRYICNGFTTVSAEDNPALVYTDKDVTIGGSNTLATAHAITLMHPLRNVFTNGVLRLQFDIRQPKSYDDNSLFSWFRLVEEYDMDLSKGSNTEFPIELGLSSTSLSGGWREAGLPDGERKFGSCSGAQPLHWYRYYVTYHLAKGDDARVGFEAYDLGLERLPMDEKPAGTPKWAKSDLLFRRNICADLINAKGEVYANTGGISGIMIRFNHNDTKGYYGEAGYDDDRAYKYDNIKVAWQAPGATDFVECYRNDFTTSKRRTVDGSTASSHTYAQEEVEETLTFSYEDATVTKEAMKAIANPMNEEKNSTTCYAYIRKSSDHSANYTPYLMGCYSSKRANQPQPIGVDGWRIAGNSNYTSPGVVTRVDGNLMLYCANYGMCRQLMCEEITSGTVKFEVDMRMPLGWTGTPRYDVCLLSAKRFNEGYSNSDDGTVRFGLSASTATSGSASSIRKDYGIYVNSTYKDNATKYLKSLHWYRFQAIVNLDTKKYDLNVYDLGTTAPADPDSVTPSLITYYSQYGYLDGDNKNGIAGWGFTNFLQSNGSYKDADGNTVSPDDVRALIDNVRLWKKVGEEWKQVFRNDFANSSRTFTNKKGGLNQSPFIDRPEYNEDGWAAAPTYSAALPITGNDSVLQFRGDFYSAVHSLGRNVRSGKLTAQYDVRLPAVWTYGQLQVELGGGTLASASTASEPYRFNAHSAIRTGFSRGGLTSAGGLYSKACYYYDPGAPKSSGYIATQLSYTWGDEYLTNAHWYRVKVEADVSAHKFDIYYYDMGTAHPTVDTPDGTLVHSYKGADFRYKDEPISHLWIFGGKTWSYAPWQDDAAGAMLIDNIRVCHDKNGLMLFVR